MRTTLAIDEKLLGEAMKCIVFVVIFLLRVTSVAEAGMDEADETNPIWGISDPSHLRASGKSC